MKMNDPNVTKWSTVMKTIEWKNSSERGRSGKEMNEHEIHGRMLLNNVQMAFNSPKSFLYFAFLCLSWPNSIFHSFISKWTIDIVNDFWYRDNAFSCILSSFYFLCSNYATHSTSLWPIENVMISKIIASAPVWRFPFYQNHLRCHENEIFDFQSFELLLYFRLRSSSQIVLILPCFVYLICVSIN